MTPSSWRVMGRSVHVMRRERPGSVVRAREPSVALKRDPYLESEEERRGARPSANRPLRTTTPPAAGEKKEVYEECVHKCSKEVVGWRSGSGCWWALHRHAKPRPRARRRRGPRLAPRLAAHVRRARWLRFRDQPRRDASRGGQRRRGQARGDVEGGRAVVRNGGDTSRWRLR